MSATHTFLQALYWVAGSGAGPMATTGKADLGRVYEHFTGRDSARFEADYCTDYVAVMLTRYGGKMPQKYVPIAPPASPAHERAHAYDQLQVGQVVRMYSLQGKFQHIGFVYASAGPGAVWTSDGNGMAKRCALRLRTSADTSHIITEYADTGVPLDAPPVHNITRRMLELAYRCASQAGVFYG